MSHEAHGISILGAGDVRGEDEEGGVGKVPKPNRTASPPALAHLHQVGAVELDEGQQHEEGHHGNVL